MRVPPPEVCRWGLLRRRAAVARREPRPVVVERPEAETPLELHLFVLREFREAARKG